MARGGFQSTKGSHGGFHPRCIFSREFAGQRVWSSGRLSQNSMIIIMMWIGKVALYKMLLGLGLHVLAVDYRSFGDSSRVALTEEV